MSRDQAVIRFHQRIATRIAMVSFLLAALASPIAWWIAREQAEQETVALAIEESDRLLRYFDASKLDTADAAVHATAAARELVDGLFDVVEIYDKDGQRLAEAMTDSGKAVEGQLPEHLKPGPQQAYYNSLMVGDKRQWIVRTFVPMAGKTADGRVMVFGYFEGVRIVPAWQEQQISASALTAALLVGLASLLCGGLLYPVMIRLFADNQRKAREVLESHLSMIEALGHAIAKRDSDTGAHNHRVAWIAARIGERLGLHGQIMQSLIVGSFLHDVGKIGVPDAILLKPGKLDEKERAIMRQHVQQGEEIVSGIGWLQGAADVVAAHHERWDGSGYPRGLAGAEIPVAARIFAVADVFDALCSRRPYKEPMPFDEVMAILEKSSGSHFDPEVVGQFRAIAGEIHQRLSGASEDDARLLLRERLHHHFEI